MYLLKAGILKNGVIENPINSEFDTQELAHAHLSFLNENIKKSKDKYYEIEYILKEIPINLIPYTAFINIDRVTQLIHNKIQVKETLNYVEWTPELKQSIKDAYEDLIASDDELVIQENLKLNQRELLGLNSNIDTEKDEIINRLKSIRNKHIETLNRIDAVLSTESYIQAEIDKNTEISNEYKIVDKKRKEITKKRI